MRGAVEKVKAVAAEFSEVYALPWSYDETHECIVNASGEVIATASVVYPDCVIGVDGTNGPGIVMAMNAFPVLLAGLLAYGDPFNWGYNFITGYTQWKGQRPGYQGAGDAIALAMGVAEEVTDEGNG